MDLSVLKPFETLLNRQLGESTAARNLVKGLEGRALGIGIGNTALGFSLAVEDEAVHVRSLEDAEPDAVITGSVLGMMGLAFGDPASGLRSGQVQITGDATIARDFQRLLEHLKPDWEEELSRVVGDVAAHQIGNAVRGLTEWGRRTVDTLGQNVAEYLQEESRDLPTRTECDEFLDAVDELRQDVDRIEARIQTLEEKGTAG